MGISTQAHTRQSVRLIVSGLGNIGRRFVAILRDKEALLEKRYGVAFTVVGAADSRGAAGLQTGLDLTTIVQLKEEGKSIADYAEYGRAGRRRSWPMSSRRSNSQRYSSSPSQSRRASSRPSRLMCTG